MKEFVENTVGNRIRHARQMSGLKTKELAEIVGVSANYASMLELGKRNPSEELLNRIAEVTKTPYLWLKEGEGEQSVYEQKRIPRRNVSNAAMNPPNPQLLLTLLKCQSPELFPDTVRTILDVSDETLEQIMDGSMEYEPKWRYAFSLLAQRIDRDTLREEFLSLDEYLDVVQIPNILQQLHIVLREYLDAEGYEEYRFKREMSCAEQYMYEGVEMNVHVLSQATNTRYGEAIWDFKYVDAGPLPPSSMGTKDETDIADNDTEGRNIISEIIDAQLDCLSNDPTARVSFVFSDAGWYDEFVHYLDKLSGTASERNRSPELMGRLSLLLTDAGMERVEHVTRGDDYYV